MRALYSLILAAGMLQAPPATAQETRNPAPQATAPSLRLPRHLIERAERRELLQRQLDRVFGERPALRDSLVALSRACRDAMVALDPETATRQARLRELEAAYTRAVLADAPRDLHTMVREGVAIQRALAATAERAARQPELHRGLEVIREAVAAAVTERDPDAALLLDEEDLVAGLVRRLASRPPAIDLGSRESVP